MPHDAAVSYRLEQAEIHISDIEKKTERMREEAEARERKRLKWGISVLGAVALYLFAKITPPIEAPLFKGPPP